MDKRFLGILVAVVVVLGGVFWFTRDKSQTNTSSNNGNSNGNVQPSNHTYGEGKSGVTLTEYADFQCPACGAYFPIVKEVKEKYKDQVTFQFRSFPLVKLHQNARAAHRAAEAAAKQGKFWEMHDLLYENQQSWESLPDPKSAFEGFAQQIGLNIDQYNKDFASDEVNDIINADFSEGSKLGVNSTPTFFLNGKKVTDNPQDVAGFSKLLDEAIKQKKQ